MDPVGQPRPGRQRSCHAQGLTFRPIAHTIRDTLEWLREQRGEKAWRTGIEAEREKQLIAALRRRQAEGGTEGDGR